MLLECLIVKFLYSLSMDIHVYVLVYCVYIHVGAVCGFHCWPVCIYHVLVQVIVVFFVVNFCVLVVEFFLVVFMYW
jgi:hypothetical protein